jgi:hypothetical protein
MPIPLITKANGSNTYDLNLSVCGSIMKKLNKFTIILITYAFPIIFFASALV